MKHAWSILCRRATVDPATNQMTLTELVEEVTLHLDRGQSVVPQSAQVDMQLVSEWHRDDPAIPERGRIRVTLKTPADPQPTVQPEMVIELESNPRIRTLMEVKVMAIRGTGEYAFEFERLVGTTWEAIGRASFNVRIEMMSEKLTPEPPAKPSPSKPKRPARSVPKKRAPVAKKAPARTAKKTRR